MCACPQTHLPAEESTHAWAAGISLAELASAEPHLSCQVLGGVFSCYWSVCRIGSSNQPTPAPVRHLAEAAWESSRFSQCCEVWRIEVSPDFNMSLLSSGFVGLFNLLLLWPGFFLLHYTGFEDFEFPNKVVLLCIIINGLIGTVLSEFLWLW